MGTTIANLLTVTSKIASNTTAGHASLLTTNGWNTTQYHKNLTTTISGNILVSPFTTEGYAFYFTGSNNSLFLKNKSYLILDILESKFTFDYTFDAAIEQVNITFIDEDAVIFRVRYDNGYDPVAFTNYITVNVQW